MKKILLILMMSVFILACGGANSGNKNKSGIEYRWYRTV